MSHYQNTVNHITDYNEEPIFSEYKPLGDVILRNNQYIRETNTQSENYNKCRPYDNDLEYQGSLFTPIIGVGAKSGTIDNNKTDRAAANALQVGSNHVYTMLVSGPDLKPPINYRLINNKTKNSGINSGFESISVATSAPTGYLALGYVVDMRPHTTGTVNLPKPSLDRIYTVPITALRELGLNTAAALTNINLFYDPSVLTGITIPGEAQHDREKHICIKSSSISTSPAPPRFNDTTLSANHDKKYSIMRVYEEDEFND